MGRVTFKKGAKVERWERNLDNPKKALKVIGQLMVSESQKAFREQKFGKEAWEPRAPINVYGIIADFAAGKAKPPARRFEPRPALVDTGRLKGPTGIAAKTIGTKIVEVGSNLPYAGVLHHGGKIESETITEKVQMALGKWLLKVEDDAIFDRLGFLLNKSWRGKKLEGKVPARPFVGITKRTIVDVRQAVGREIMEVR